MKSGRLSPVEEPDEDEEGEEEEYDYEEDEEEVQDQPSRDAPVPVTLTLTDPDALDCPICFEPLSPPVIVRDIAKKTVIAQFRAHKSPILSLCFDLSGTLLVTASVQGHNINVFRIMPGLSGAASYVHLYRLQRGFTNAVIQDISFSSNSNWILISSSRGTSHLFVISPSGGLVSFQSADACRVKNNGSSLMSNTPVSLIHPKKGPYRLMALVNRLRLLKSWLMK